MYFPWVGMLEQVRLADIFVHYDDVQFSKGSFTNRVQIKQPNGSVTWMTVPLQNQKVSQNINEVAFQDKKNWKSKHMAILESSFTRAPFRKDALDLAEIVLSQSYETIADLSRASLYALVDYFGLNRFTRFIDSTSLGIKGSSSQRVFDVVKSLKGSRYITGHGAFNYLDHDLFEQSGIEVCYMQYQRKPYPQSHGVFTPYVSALDLIAHTGSAGIDYLVSSPIYWRKFQSESK
jgi:WbqC-like protein family